MNLLALSLALTVTPAPARGTPRPLRLDGGFIQYQEWMMRLNADAWHRELDAMRRAKMRIVVLQYLASGEQRFIPARAGATDPTAVILDYADRHDMEVYVGLSSDEGWWKQATDAAYLDGAARACLRLADEAWRRYGKHRSFAGWYLPQELWDASLDDGQIARLRGFFRRVSDGCKRLSGPRPVAIAPFFSGISKPEVVERVYGALLEGSGIDIVMPQDGVGARGWDDQVESRVVPYFRAFRGACLRAGAAMWSDLESFRRADTGRGFQPTTAERVSRQITAEAPFVERFVTFDFFHYMSPHRGEAQKRLYDDYVARFVDRAFEPALGRSLEVDPGFAYYRNRSPESVAAEIRAAGYPIVVYVLTADSAVQPALIDAFRREGIGVWYLTFGNGTYSTQDLPKGWEAWKMVTRSDLEGKPLNDGYTRLCLSNPDYRAWRKRQIGRMLTQHPFVGVQIAEPHWPEYPGITSPAYACFCGHCRDAFRRMFPDESELPDILHPESARGPVGNPELWAKWLRFREASLTGFLNDLVNGEGGIRQTAPRALVGTWTLALSGEDGLKRVREDSGEDAARVVTTVRPDLHCFQTHWPDWVKADLPPDYVRHYQPFVDGVRAVAPDLPLSFQADTGSLQPNRRSWDWIAGFERASERMGVLSTTIYEYFIGLYTYTDPPRIAAAERRGDAVRLVFTKPLAAAAAEPSRYSVTGARVATAVLDGNIVTLRLTGAAPGKALEVTARGISDDEARRLFHDRPPATLDEQTVIARAIP